MNRRFLFLLPLVFLIFACAALPNFATPVATIVLKPVDPAKADSASLEQTRQIIEQRLNYAGIRGKVSLLDQGNISVEIYSADDLDNAQKLSTEIGAFAFSDSLESYPVGSKLETVSAAILTQDDVKTAVPQKSTTGTYEIAVQFTPEGTKKMADYSGKNIGHFLLITKDGVILLAPRLSGAITDGNAVITGDFDLATANSIAAQLHTRSLPFALEVDQIKKSDTK